MFNEIDRDITLNLVYGIRKIVKDAVLFLSTFFIQLDFVRKNMGEVKKKTKLV